VAVVVEAESEVVEVDTLEPTDLQLTQTATARLRIRPLKAGLLRSNKLHPQTPNQAKKPNRRLKLLPLAKETTLLLPVDGETHLLPRRFKRPPSLVTRAGKERASRLYQLSTRQLQLPPVHQR
jgi:hypothetical protein